MTIEVGICQNTKSQYNTKKKQHNDSCKDWVKYDIQERRATPTINTNTIICATCNFWKKIAELKQRKLPQ